VYLLRSATVHANNDGGHASQGHRRSDRLLDPLALDVQIEIWPNRRSLDLNPRVVDRHEFVGWWSDLTLGERAKGAIVCFRSISFLPFSLDDRIWSVS
jgi:hypothetical protein